jgi:hypothetical protein
VILCRTLETTQRPTCSWQKTRGCLLSQSLSPRISPPHLVLQIRTHRNRGLCGRKCAREIGFIMGMPTPSKRLLPPLKCKVSASSAVLAAGTSVRAASPPAVSLMLRVGSWNRVGTRNPNRGAAISTTASLYSGGQRGMTRIGPSHPERTESS